MPGLVSDGAVLEGEISTMPASEAIREAGSPALEQLVPMTPIRLGSATSLVSAVWPPSALHMASSPTSSMGCPRTSASTSSMAISIPRRESTPSDSFGPAITRA